MDWPPAYGRWNLRVVLHKVPHADDPIFFVTWRSSSPRGVKRRGRWASAGEWSLDKPQISFRQSKNCHFFEKGC
jgi:hypothetical protein